MYPTLYHFFYDLTGWEVGFLKVIPMFGFWVITAFMVASWLSVIELKRREEAGYISPKLKTVTIGAKTPVSEYVSNGVIGFLLGFKIGYVFFHQEVLENFPSFLISTQGSLIGGLLVGAAMVGWKYREAKKTELPEPYEKEVNMHPYQHMSNITMLSIASGMGGSVIFGTLEKPYLISEFFANPSLGISHLYNGLSVYGGVILGILIGMYYVWKNKLNLIQFLDALVPTILMAYAIGRIGCHMAGDGDWGIVNTNPQPEWMSFLPDWLWAYDYPNNVNGDGVPMTNCIYNDPKYCNHLVPSVYPTPLYEFFMSTILFGILWSVRKLITIPLLMFSLVVLAMGVERYIIEQIRVNTVYEHGPFAGFTQAEAISIGMIILGIGMGIYSVWRYKKNQAHE